MRGTESDISFMYMVGGRVKEGDNLMKSVLTDVRNVKKEYELLDHDSSCRGKFKVILDSKLFA